MHKRYHKRGRKRIGAGIKNVFEETDMQVQEAQRIPKKINPNRPTPTYYNKNGKVSLVLSWYRICLQCRKAQFDSWVGKICWRRDRLLTPVFPLRELHGLYSPRGRKESDTTEQLSLSLSLVVSWLRSSNPHLQCRGCRFNPWSEN